MQKNNISKESTVLVTIRIYESALSAAKDLAKKETERLGKRVTYNEILRSQVETGKAIMLFETDPTNLQAARNMLKHITIASIGAYSFLQEQ